MGDAFGHNHKQKGFLYILSLRTDISQFEICFFLRLKTCGFLHSNYIFCLFFPFSPSDVHKYASRSKAKNSAPNPPAHTCASNFDLSVFFLRDFFAKKSLKLFKKLLKKYFLFKRQMFCPPTPTFAPLGVLIPVGNQNLKLRLSYFIILISVRVKV